MTLSNFIPICNAIVTLMDPLIEIAIHDITTNKISYINGKLSKRNVGDDSWLNVEDLSNIEQITYPKINYDNRLIKSISVRLEDQYILCINCDVSIFNKIQVLSETLLQMDNQPKTLFFNDWKEKLHTSIHSFLQANNLSLDCLLQKDKKRLARHLFDLGAFDEKNAADYIAKILGLGRATIFKYLKEWRTE